MDNAHAEMLVATLPDDTLLMVVGALRIETIDRYLSDRLDLTADAEAGVVRALWRNDEDPGIFDPRCTCTLRISNPTYPDQPEARRIDFSRAVACPVHADAVVERHRFTVTVDGCTHDEAHRVMTERLGHDEDYGFEYGLDWGEESITPWHRVHPGAIEASALSISTVSAARFGRSQDGTVKGVVADGLTGIEFDVRLSGDDVWYVNDDDGVTYEDASLQRALTRAIEANRGSQ